MFLRALLIIFIIALVASAFGVMYLSSLARNELDLTLFTIDKTKSATNIYVMENGEWVEWEEERIHSGKSFIYASIEDMPRDLINAFVAIEDKRFFEHHGVDIYRTVAAGANYFLHFDSRFGASTITQQIGRAHV